MLIFSVRIWNNLTKQALWSASITTKQITYLSGRRDTSHLKYTAGYKACRWWNLKQFLKMWTFWLCSVRVFRSMTCSLNLRKLLLDMTNEISWPDYWKLGDLGLFLPLITAFILKKKPKLFFKTVETYRFIIKIVQRILTASLMVYISQVHLS